jgi:GTPase
VSTLLAVDDLPEGHRSAIVCLAGRPNVGKSTLLNAMVGAKIAIVTAVPGTTRNAIRGVLTRDDAQLVFIDTPGLVKPRTLLNRRLNELVRETWRAVDLVCLLVDATEGIGPGDRFLAEQLGGTDGPVICVVNKVDRKKKDALLPVLADVDELADFAEIVPVSAKTGENVDRLVDILVAHAPDGPRLFPEGVVTDQPEGGTRSNPVIDVVREENMESSTTRRGFLRIGGGPRHHLDDGLQV